MRGRGKSNSIDSAQKLVQQNRTWLCSLCLLHIQYMMSMHDMMTTKTERTPVLTNAASMLKCCSIQSQAQMLNAPRQSCQSMSYWVKGNEK